MPANSRGAVAKLAVNSQSNIKDEFDPVISIFHGVVNGADGRNVQNDMPLTIFNRPEDLQNPKSSSLTNVRVSSEKKEDAWKSEEKFDVKTGTDDAKGLPLKSNEDDTKPQESSDTKPHFGEPECRPSVTPPPTYEFVVDPRHIPDYNDGGEDYVLDPPTPLPPSPEGDEPTMAGQDHEGAEVTRPRQAKRRKVFMDAVEVPTVQSILGDRVKRLTPVLEESDEEAKVKLENLKNPKVKKKEGRLLSLDTVRERLRGISLDPYPIPLDKSIIDVEITRRFLSHHYGGGEVAMFPQIGKKFLDVHDLRDFMYPNLDHNPHCPEVPGAPGLYFSADGVHAWPWPDIQRVITRIRSGRWQYQGQYQLAPVKSLTKEEWASQDRKFRNTWAKEIHESAWGIVLRAKIHLRERLGRECTEAELNEALDSNRQFKEITPDIIIRAFHRGEEFIAVWTMKCVGYDTEFQRNLADKFPTWVPPPPKQKTKKGARTPRKKVVLPKTQPKTGQKRKHAAADLSDEEDDSDSSNGSDTKDPQDTEPEEVEEVAYQTRGTRSRPIIL
ncbi:hypothetical protein Hypma_012570 [Hypsizygus marmoreus]|uniref:DUF6697 domain-containing protein n=1 Tax=Hypsizygus marmoreus TaxID=39966 RepID=A0A369JE15_HYPMA|nr:hypothetical protein Hypma_012570 [Hypsizygus marmoreus]